MTGLNMVYKFLQDLELMLRHILRIWKFANIFSDNLDVPRTRKLLNEEVIECDNEEVIDCD